MAGLSGVFALTNTSEDAFVSAPALEGGTRVYGGHMIAQALLACFGTLPPSWACYCAHAQFMRIGSPLLPIEYFVERTSESRNFAVRRVVAIQNQRTLLTLNASFNERYVGLNFQSLQAPVALPPEGFVSEAERFAAVAAHLDAAEQDFQRLPSGVDARWTDPQDLERPVIKSPAVRYWLRCTEDYDERDPTGQVALAYCSDFTFLEPILRPHGFSLVQPAGLMIGSLDHSIWFHRPARMSDWHLCDARCVSTSNGIGFVRGELFAAGGHCVASVAQQSVFRVLAPAA